ncbi:MAG: hypothetical protein DRJ07_08525 [Bacteroidetes bacterium]|nr:MAG: hypothetical protein DRJ07_08525 [Bacteroidota bacterium]
MKKALYIFLILIILSLIAFAFVWFMKPPVPEFGELAEFQTENISAVEYDDYNKQSLYFSLTDSTQIAMDVFVPKGEDGERFPVIFEYTPYNRSAYVPGLPWYVRIGAKWKVGQWGPIFDYAARFVQRNLIARGYAYVIADVRGTGASSGMHTPLDPQIGKDGKEIIEWIAQQNWSNGKIGMIGQSYHAWTQWATASQQPEALKCIAPALIMFDTYSEANKPGGIIAQSWVSQYSDFLEFRNHNILDTVTLALPVYPVAPVTDEDNDGSLDDEVPVMTGNPTQSFVNQKEPVYEDGNTRAKNIYFNYTMQHLKDKRPDELMVEPFKYFDDELFTEKDTANWYQTNPGFMIPKVVEANIAVLNIGGWFDGFGKGTPQLHASMAHMGGNSRLFMLPRFHQPTNKIIEPYREYFNYKGDLHHQQFVHTLRFFDFYLKGVKNGWDEEPPVYVYVMNKGWQHHDNWPPKTVKNQELYLTLGNSLTDLKPDSAMIEYNVNFTHASDYGEPTLNRWVMVNPSRELMDRTDLDTITLLFETPVLEKDSEIGGFPIAEIFLGCNQSDADIFVYLCDVDENGKSIYVSEGQLRASWHRLYNPNLQVNNTYDVMPVLPWHGFEHDMELQNPTENDSIVKMKFDLFPVSWVFKKGHRIRIAVAGVDKGNFEINSSWLDENGKEKEDVRLRIYTGNIKASRIILPFVE